MLRQRHINGDPGGRARRFASAAVDVARWPFERAAWSVERSVLWPLQRRFAGWSPPGRSFGAAAGLAAIGLAAILAAILVLPGGGAAPPERVARPTVAIVPPSKPRPRPAESQEPTLQGVQPHFGVGKGVAKSGGEQAGAGDPAAGSGSSGAGAVEPEPTATADGAAAEEEAAATASAAGKPVPAGPVAMKVARRFSEAFVFYEIGKKPARAKTVFGETATEQLAEALQERPPRLPSNGKVPKAKVLNLVAGPRFGKQYTVSVSLLRVGVTSELRITLQKEEDGEWRVAQILG
ncbi:MAG TPA: hypothetical protein VFG58_02160 [Solirubrobacterales bacterium]|nr:hypothetical protein [Solirubrobacterales bacterium]